jgi:hypothetical protein
MHSLTSALDGGEVSKPENEELFYWTSSSCLIIWLSTKQKPLDSAQPLYKVLPFFLHLQFCLLNLTWRHDRHSNMKSNSLFNKLLT